MLEYLSDRRNHIKLFFLFVSAIMILKLAVLTVAEGEYYREMSVNKRLKEIPIVAKRGEVFDRNGQLLAGNATAFTVQMISGEMPPEDFSPVALRIINLLDRAGEAHAEFPIQVKGNQKYFQGDIEVNNWLVSNGYEVGTTAEQVFQMVRSQEQISSAVDLTAAQKFMLLKGIYLPISVKNGLKFTYANDKKNFLEMYGLPEETTAEQAFVKIREKFKIPEKYSDADAYKILILYHALKGKGYRKYQPIKVANRIKKETAVLIEEMSMDLPGIKVEIEPVRTYPMGSLASHVIGYMGKISTDKEKEKYNSDELVGRTGIESAFEDTLRGTNGYKYVEVDVTGRQVREVNQSILDNEPTSSKAGKSVQLTIDSELQKTTEESLEKALAAIRVGGRYQSPWGSHDYSKAYPKAYTGAAVVVNVNTGEILAIASYPGYDPNLFSAGISSDAWAALQPKNPRDPLAPRPLYNLASQTAVQPGSTFKMITGYAALESGFSATTRVKDGGAITTADGTTRACWIWNQSRGNHGYINLTEALEVSCNYYFFDVSNGYDYYADKPLNFTMNAAKLIDYAKLFGLNDATGLEIGEVVAGVPNPEKKKQDLLYGLKKKIKEIGPNYFPKETIEDEDKFNDLMKKINALADQNMGRRALIQELIKLGSNADEKVTEKLADTIKYSYFTQMKWFEGDTFNLSIGQGSHSYTPVQMARYIAAVANDGNLNKLSVIKAIDGVPVKREAPVNINPNNNMHYLREGMYLVANGPKGTSRGAFSGFPVKVAAKTGTAEKEGKLPPEKEEDYLRQYLKWIAPKLGYGQVEQEAVKILADRNTELAELENKLKGITDSLADIDKKNKDVTDQEKLAEIALVKAPLEEEKAKYDSKIQRFFGGGLLTRGSAMREAIKVLTNGTVKDEEIDRFKDGYDNFTWFVSFAPYENPEIAVVVLIPQGGSGGYAGPIVKDIYAKYFNLQPTDVPAGTQRVDANEAIQ